MRILRPIVEPTADLVPIGCNTDIVHRRGIGTKPIDNDAPRWPIFLHDPLEKLHAAALSRFEVTTASRTSPSWSTARHR